MKTDDKTNPMAEAVEALEEIGHAIVEAAAKKPAGFTVKITQRDAEGRIESADVKFY